MSQATLQVDHRKFPCLEPVIGRHVDKQALSTNGFIGQIQHCAETET